MPRRNRLIAHRKARRAVDSDGRGVRLVFAPALSRENRGGSGLAYAPSRSRPANGPLVVSRVRHHLNFADS